LQETKLLAAIEGIDNKITPFQELQRRMERRATLKVDFDAYSRKVRILKERNDDTSIEKLQKTEIKLIHARTALYDATQDLYMTFGYYEELGTCATTPGLLMFCHWAHMQLHLLCCSGSFLMAPEIEMVKQGLKAFFESSHQVMSGMQALDPIFLRVEVERKGQNGAAKLTFERPSMSMRKYTQFRLTVGNNMRELTRRNHDRDGHSFRRKSDWNCTERLTKGRRSAAATHAVVETDVREVLANVHGRNGPGQQRRTVGTDDPCATVDGASGVRLHAAGCERAAAVCGRIPGGDATGTVTRPVCRIPCDASLTNPAFLFFGVLEQDPSGWWFGQKVFEDGTVATGVFPGNYVSVLTESAAL
jgi:hypothetical protein